MQALGPTRAACVAARLDSCARTALTIVRDQMRHSAYDERYEDVFGVLLALAKQTVAEEARAEDSSAKGRLYC